MEKVTFSQEEIMIFALLTLDLQLRAGLIDEEHLPDKRLTDQAKPEVDALKKKIDETKTIPHPQDLASATEALYENRDDFIKMFETCVDRAREEGTLPKKESIH